MRPLEKENPGEGAGAGEEKIQGMVNDITNLPESQVISAKPTPQAMIAETLAFLHPGDEPFSCASSGPNLPIATYGKAGPVAKSRLWPGEAGA